MSSFLTSDATRAAISVYLIDNASYIKFITGRNIFEGMNYKSVYEVLSRLNIYALSERYGINEAYECMNSINMNMNFENFKNISKGTFSKHIHCYTYQCCLEGTIANYYIIEYLEELIEKIDTTFTTKDKEDYNNTEWK